MNRLPLIFGLAVALAAPAPGKIKAKITASQAQIQAFLGTQNAKLVFESGGVLYTVDFSSATPAIAMLDNMAGGILPSFSPDGQHVVYATGVRSEGVGGASKVWVSPLSPGATPVLVADPGYEPRFVQSTQDPTAIYTTAGGANLYEGKGQTVKKAVKNNLPDANPTVVFAGGGYVGGLSYDGRYLATGFQQGRLLDLQSPTASSVQVHLLTFKNKVTQADTSISLQVCNTSISASRIFSGAMMYIDFGFSSATYAHEWIAGGESWGIHDIIYISNYQNALLKQYEVPEYALGLNSGDPTNFHWDDPKWSNHPYFAAANLQIDRSFMVGGKWEETKNHEGIYFINLKDSTYLKVMESEDVTYTSPTDMKWPYLWVEIPPTFQEDPRWLGGVVMGNSAPGQFGPEIDVRFDPRRGRFLSSRTLSAVSIYRADGRLAGRFFPGHPGQKTLVIDSRAGWASGYYLVSARLSGGAQKTFWWRVFN